MIPRETQSENRLRDMYNLSGDSVRNAVDKSGQGFGILPSDTRHAASLRFI